MRHVSFPCMCPPSKYPRCLEQPFQVRANTVTVTKQPLYVDAYWPSTVLHATLALDDTCLDRSFSAMFPLSKYSRSLEQLAQVKANNKL